MRSVKKSLSEAGAVRTVAVMLLAGASMVAIEAATPSVAFADCVLAMPSSTGSGNNPPSGSTVNCANNLDNDGVVNAGANDVTVNVEGPAGGISTTGAPGILLGNGATINVSSQSNRPINTSGDSAGGIDVLDDASITVGGQVTTSGENSEGIFTGSGAMVEVQSTGRVSTGGGKSAGISVGANSTVDLRGEGGDIGAVVTTGNSNSDAVVLGGANGTLNIENGAQVTTSSGMSNPVQVDGENGTVNVSGRVQSSSGNATAILGTARGLNVTVEDGGFVTAQSSGSNAIESQGRGASITVASGGEVRISSGNSAGIVSGDNAIVTVAGTVSASSSASQGVILGNNAELVIEDSGIIETSSSESQAVLVSSSATTASITVNRAGSIDAVGAQAIVDEGETETTVTVDGTVFGGSSDPVLDMGAGNDTVTVNGTVRGSSANPVIDLGAGNDTLTNASSRTISGPGKLVDAGSGGDTLNVSTGNSQRSSRYSGFETTNVSRNTNPNDPQMGQTTTFVVDNNQSNNNVNAREGGNANVNSGGSVRSLTARDGGQASVNRGGSAGNVRAQGTGSAVTVQNGGTAGARTNAASGGGSVSFARGSTANIDANGFAGNGQGVDYNGVNFDPSTSVDLGNRAFVSADASGSAVTFGFAPNVFRRNGNTNNTRAAGAAIDAALVRDASFLDNKRNIALARQERAVPILSRVSGETVAELGVGMVNAGSLFNTALRGGGSAAERSFVYGYPASSAPVGTPSGVAISAVPDNLESAPQKRFGADLALEPLQPIPPAPRFGVWVAALGGFFDIDSGPSTGADGYTAGVALGVERQFLMASGSVTAGLGVGYTYTEVNNTVYDNDANGYHVGAYVNGQFDLLDVSAAASYAYFASDVGNQNGDSQVVTLGADAAYNIGGRFAEPLILGPVGRLQFNYADIGRTGPLGPLGTTVGGDFAQLLAAAGVRIGTKFNGGSVYADVMYERVIGDDNLVLSGNFAGGPGFNVGASTGDRDRLLLRAGANFDISEQGSFSLEGTTTYDGNWTNAGGMARFTFRF
ncbi:hypothetical protein RDV64_09070 [Acuticoccus sp. MNP-M23]|uniref:autotransporter outer membrane beta-barrel domain-containing protein n=1 Tax=Acuticoccus sp. MNP-M23 TaxID=3072793 RepID=UPI002814E75F|nr:hypothetical protein [Acuticoccus sp. MNP-M23]WMS44516.1 hypothetical protein RDV64_09070 [Acuticoccus sp. MNP-M23]